MVQKTVFEGHFFRVPSLTEVAKKRQDGFAENEAVFEGQNKHCYNSVITPRVGTVRRFTWQTKVTFNKRVLL